MRYIYIYIIYLPGLRAGQKTTVNTTDNTQIIICSDEFVNQAAVLDCPVGSFVNLTYVNWGRTRPYSEVCDYHDGISRTDCTSDPVVTQRARDICQGQQSCQLAYDGLDLLDTCFGTYKYFDVRYTCMRTGEHMFRLRSWHNAMWCISGYIILLHWMSGTSCQSIVDVCQILLTCRQIIASSVL